MMMPTSGREDFKRPKWREFRKAESGKRKKRVCPAEVQTLGQPVAE